MAPKKNAIKTRDTVNTSITRSRRVTKNISSSKKLEISVINKSKYLYLRYVLNGFSSM